MGKSPMFPDTVKPDGSVLMSQCFCCFLRLTLVTSILLGWSERGCTGVYGKQPTRDINFLHRMPREFLSKDAVDMRSSR
jgi:hypothetical protein